MSNQPITEVTEVIATTETPEPSIVMQPGIVESIMPFVLIMAVFYFLIIRPQSKKAKEVQNTISSLKKGDDVLCASGLYGKIAKVNEDDTMILEIADKVLVKAKKDSVIELIKHDKKA